MRQVNQTMRYGDGRVMRNSLEECATVLSECKGIIEGSSKGKEKAAALMEKISALADSVGNALTAPMPNAKNKDFFDEYNEAFSSAVCWQQSLPSRPMPKSSMFSTSSATAWGSTRSTSPRPTSPR